MPRKTQSVLGVLAAAGLWLLVLFFFGTRGGMMRGERAPVNKYIPSLSPLVQHTLQCLFLLALLFAVFPSFIPNWLACCVGSCNRPHWLGDKSKIADPLFETIVLASSRGRLRKHQRFAQFRASSRLVGLFATSPGRRHLETLH